MNKIAGLTVLAPFAALALVTIDVHADTGAHADAAGLAPRIADGRMVYAANGQRLVPVYRVNGDGTVQMMMGRRLLTIPAALLTDVDGRLTASANKADLLR